VYQLFLFLPLLFLSLNSFAQSKYWVFLKDKGGQKDYIYLNKDAQRNRIINGVNYDALDLPVFEKYKDKLQFHCDSLGYSSRWLNAVAVWAIPTQIEIIKNLPFVSQVQLMHGSAQILELESDLKYKGDSVLSDIEYDLALRQLKLFGHIPDNSLHGEGVIIAILDVGFNNVNKLSAFKHCMSRIVGTYDFVKKKADVYDAGTHGTTVMSCIAGQVNDSLPLGLGTKAKFLLARTERTITELSEEEDNWIAAVEWAETKGARIVNSSLGYTSSRYFQEDMDGYSSPISRAANVASKKGMLIVNAMGNDGTTNWKTICAPADATEVLAVGGIDPETGLHIDFSSYGKQSDVVKPNVCASGVAVVASPSGGYFKAQGTSYAAPLVAGFLANLLSDNPNMTRLQLMEYAQKNATLYPYFDYAHGYGIAKQKLSLDAADTSQLNLVEYTVTILSDSNDVDYINVNISGIDNGKPNYLYYHIADLDDKLVYYNVTDIELPYSLKIDLLKYPISEGVLRLSIGGSYNTFNFTNK